MEKISQAGTVVIPKFNNAKPGAPVISKTQSRAEKTYSDPSSSCTRASAKYPVPFYFMHPLSNRG